MSVLLVSVDFSDAVFVVECLDWDDEDCFSDAVSVVSLSLCLVVVVSDWSECLCDQVRLLESFVNSSCCSRLLMLLVCCDGSSESLCDHLRLAMSYIFLSVGFAFFFERPVSEVSDVDLFNFLAPWCWVALRF